MQVGFDIFTENALYLGKVVLLLSFLLFICIPSLFTIGSNPCLCSLSQVRDFEFSLESGNVTSLEFDSFGVPLIPSSVVSVNFIT